MATENRSNNCKNQTSNRTSNQTSNRTSNQTSNSATNEHKHPNQYTKGADDESAKKLHEQPFQQRQKQPLTPPCAPDGPQTCTL